FEVSSGAHYTQGGCWVNEKCHTSLKGLYAIGETASGLDGADRMAGNALPFCMGMGIIAGKEAALEARSAVIPQVDRTQVEKLKEEALAPLLRGEGAGPLEIKETIQKNMEAHAQFFRNENGLRDGLKAVDEIREKSLPNLAVSARNRRYNLEWVDALEVRNMVDIAEMTFRSALMRTESRGAHERADYPEEKHEWLKNIILQKVKGEMALSTQPVALPYYKPEESE
ncbi:FAD-binding protein, partial [Chloroflexota bacterium]